MKKFLAMFLIFATLLASTAVQAGFSDIPEDAVYLDAANRLNALNIMMGSGSNIFDPKAPVTKEQFAVIIVRAAGLKDTAETMKGSTVYSDVNPSSETSGYISVAVSKGYMAGSFDGKFHPEDNITFAQVCTAVTKALGYADQDVQGQWPKSYMEKASKLGLTDGINLNSNDPVARWELAIIVDRLLDTNMKKASPSEADRSFADAAGLYAECIILANSLTSNKLADNQVLTNKGIYYIKDRGLKLELGNTYRLDIDNDTIKAAYGMQRTLEYISVDSTVGTKVSYKGDNNEVLYKTLPDKTEYYYQGVKQNYDNLKNIIQTRSSIVFALNKNKSGYDYAVIFDPVYSKPEVARNFQPSAKQLGSISIPMNPVVIREGVLSDVLHIREKDVVYKISDIWNKYTHILVINNRVGGRITEILPDKVNPKTLKVDGKEYGFGSDIDLNRLSVRLGALNEKDNIVLLLGYDGKIVDLEYPGSEDNSSYALVLNSFDKIASNANDGTLSHTYSVKMLTGEGITATYYVQGNAAEYKGKLVKYKKVDNRTVALEHVYYNFPKELSVNKLDGSINEDYVADNAKIFNVISDNEGEDIQANVLEFKDLPHGALPNGKVYFMEKTGSFNDVSVMLTNDILGQGYTPAIVKSAGMQNNGNSYSYFYTLLVEGKEYTFNEIIANASTGSVVDVKLSQEGIRSAKEARRAGVENNSVEDYDARRIKINGKVYWLKNNISVYFTDYQGNITAKSLANVNINEFYGSVSLYFDKPLEQGGKVDVIVIKQ